MDSLRFKVSGIISFDSLFIFGLVHGRLQHIQGELSTILPFTVKRISHYRITGIVQTKVLLFTDKCYEAFLHRLGWYYNARFKGLCAPEKIHRVINNDVAAARVVCALIEVMNRVAIFGTAVIQSNGRINSHRCMGKMNAFGQLLFRAADPADNKGVSLMRCRVPLYLLSKINDLLRLKHRF